MSDITIIISAIGVFSAFVWVLRFLAIAFFNWRIRKLYFSYIEKTTKIGVRELRLPTTTRAIINDKFKKLECCIKWKHYLQSDFNFIDKNIVNILKSQIPNLYYSEILNLLSNTFNEKYHPIYNNIEEELNDFRRKSVKRIKKHFDTLTFEDITNLIFSRLIGNGIYNYMISLKKREETK